MKSELKQKASSSENEFDAAAGLLLSVVIPTYGRGSVLDKHVAHIRDVLSGDSVYGRSFELILVDDHSPDDTAMVIRSLCRRWSDVKGILLAENVGQQNATLAGLRRASGHSVVTMDDDLKDDPKDIRLLLDLLAEDYDVVYGVPADMRSARLHRRFGTALKESIIDWSCRKPEGIQLTGFRAMNRQTADRVARETRQHVYVSATILQEPVRVGQVLVREGRGASLASGYSMTKLAGLIFRLTVQYGRCPVFKPFRKAGRQYEIREVIGCDS